MPLEPYPYPREVTMAQETSKQVAFSQAQANNIGGGVWTRKRRTRATGAGKPAVEEVTTGITPIWVYKAAWQLPGGIDQPTEGQRFVAAIGLLQQGDVLESETDPTVKLIVVAVEREMTYAEGSVRPLP